jgi:polyisoprenoid-binding protein YceI
MDDETAGEQAGPTKRRALRWWIVGAVAVVVVLAAGGPFVYIHLIEGPAPSKLTLPGASTGSASTGSSGTSGSVGATAGQVAGTWAVGPGSIVGYRVQEVLIGQHATAVGRTTKVSGTVTIDGTTVTAATVTVDMASVESDQSERNAQFDGRIMDVAMYPTATLHLTEPLALGTVPAPGHQASYRGTGTLTMHGVTRTITVPLSAERTGTGIDVLAEIPIIFAGWNIANPSTGGFVTTASDGILEVLLHLTRGAGNPAVTNANSGSSGSGGGPGGPITVPSTTVPPLTIPTGG